MDGVKVLVELVIVALHSVLGEVGLGIHLSCPDCFSTFLICPFLTRPSSEMFT